MLKQFTLVSVLSCILTTVIYYHTLDYPFVLDDEPHIVEEKSIRWGKIHLENLSLAIKGLRQGRKLPRITFALNYYFSEYNPRYYRLTNIVIHFINSIQVYLFVLLTLRIYANSENSPIKSPAEKSRNSDATPQSTIYFIAAVTSIIWVVHPVQIQSVTYIIQRMNSLSVMFYLGSLILYITGRSIQQNIGRQENRKTFYRVVKITVIATLYALSAGSWVCAMGSKEIAITVPIIMYLYEWYFFRRLNRGFFLKTIPVIVLLAILLTAVAYFYLNSNPFNVILESYNAYMINFTLTERVLTELRVLVFYFVLLLIPQPYRLNLQHHYDLSTTVTNPPSTLICLILLCFLMYLVFMLAKRGYRLLSFCIAWYFVTLAVESSVIGVELIYEHRLYLPSVTIILAIVVFYCRSFQFPNRRVMMIAPSAVILLFALWTYQRNQVWQDPFTVWKDCVAKAPKSDRSNYNLAYYLEKRGDAAAAIHHYGIVTELNPKFSEAFINLGSIHYKQGRYHEAIKCFGGVTHDMVLFIRGQQNLAATYYKVRDYEKAAFHYQRLSKLLKNRSNWPDKYLAESKRRLAAQKSAKTRTDNP